jgi:hypothetical protein
MTNAQLFTVVATILLPNLAVWGYVVRNSKSIGVLEGFLLKELKAKEKE